MIINNIPFTCELIDIIEELQAQLHINNIPLINDFKDSGNDIMITCPYHKYGQERKPSAGIRKSDGQFHCFTCGETHSLQEVISHCFGYTNDLAGAKGWEWLLKNFLTISIEERKPIQLDINRHQNFTPEVQYVSETELDSYRYYHEYMWKRKLTPEIVELFDIGYDKETQCITFPIRDITGGTVFVARRSVNTKFFNYPNGAEKPLYGLYELNQLDKFPEEVIICESMLDALTCWAYGKYAVALNGLGNELQFKQLRDLNCRKLILATDNDDAGLKARKRIKRNVRNKIITEFDYMTYPIHAKDINDMSKDEFEKLIELF